MSEPIARRHDNRPSEIAARHSRAAQERLASKIMAGDARALATMYDLYGRMAYGLACAVVGNPSDAEHVVTEAYAQIWRTAQTFEFARGSLETWIATIVLTRALDVWRGQHRRASLFATDVPMHERRG